MPERYGNWKTVYDRFRRWAEDGTLEKLFGGLMCSRDTVGEVAKRRSNEPL